MRWSTMSIWLACIAFGGCAAIEDLVFVALYDASPVRASQPARPRIGTTSPGSLSVMTANLKGCRSQRRLAELVDTLRASPRGTPDFVLCQEVIFGASLRYAHTAEILADQLGYCVRGRCRGSDDEGIAIVSRYPFSHFESRALEARTVGVLLGFERVSTMGEFEVPDVGLVRVVNVHLAHWPFEEHVRVRQIEETLDWLGRRDRAVRADVVILGGDFNATWDSQTLASVRRWRSARGAPMRDCNATAPTMTLPVPRRIDYIFVNAERHVAMMDEEIIAMGVISGLRSGTSLRISDHDAVVHRYQVAPSRTAEVAARTRSLRFPAATTGGTARPTLGRTATATR